VARKRPGLVAARRVFAVVCGFVGLFVVFFGLGMGKPSVVLTGVAVGLFAVASRLVGMLRGTMRQWVVGVGRVVYVASPPPAAPYGRLQLELTVDAPGMPPEAVIIREPRVAVENWPSVGDELSIEVAADDVRNVRILWPDTEPEDEFDPAWDDDQPDPVPAEPPGSHLHPPGEHSDDLADDLLEHWDDETTVQGRDRPRAGEEPAYAPAPQPREEIDFNLDGPPAGPAPAAAGASAPDEGRPGRHVPLAHESAIPSPRPTPGTGRRPSPHPRPPAPPPASPEAPGREATIYPSANPAPAGAIHRVGVTLLVADLARSAAFYRDRLGFHEVDRGRDSLVLASGENRLVLRALQKMDPVHRRVAHLNLEVADIEAVYADLIAAGVRFTYPPRVVDHGAQLELWAAAFKDPDGHGIALTQWRPRGVADQLSGSTGGAHPRP
jgi:resuscitation-promoting factor RpfA